MAEKKGIVKKVGEATGAVKLTSNKIEDIILKRVGNVAGGRLSARKTAEILDKVFKVDPENIQEKLGGYLLKDIPYYQMLTINYPEERNLMHILIETQNDEGDKAKHELELTGYQLVLIKQNE